MPARPPSGQRPEDARTGAPLMQGGVHVARPGWPPGFHPLDPALTGAAGVEVRRLILITARRPEGAALRT